MGKKCHRELADSQFRQEKRDPRPAAIGGRQARGFKECCLDHDGP